MNKQAIHKQSITDGLKLSVHSIFQTIQGEGPFVGEPSVFLRLFGCNLRCPLCDTDYTSVHNISSINEIENTIDKFSTPNKLVVITGGEPFRQNIIPLINLLWERKYVIQIETNGTLFLDDFPFEKASVVCSPKTGKIHKKLAYNVIAYKYVLEADSIHEDGLPRFALRHPARPKVARPPENYKRRIYVQPADVGNKKENLRNLTAAIKSCLTHGYTLGIQIHKIINME